MLGMDSGQTGPGLFYGLPAAIIQLQPQLQLQLQLQPQTCRGGYTVYGPSRGPNRLLVLRDQLSKQKQDPQTKGRHSMSC